MFSSVPSSCEELAEDDVPEGRNKDRKKAAGSDLTLERPRILSLRVRRLKIHESV
jgi:hypothetical protein